MKDTALPKKLGRYEIIRELGKGAMGIVYEGRDPSLGRTVAIKTARKDVIESSGLAKEMLERFLREARAAGVLNHPNIITIYDVGEEEGMAYIAMEFLEGRDLDAVIEEQRRFDIKDVVEYGVPICEALACAHDQGVFHRDIKPANIFIPDQGVLKVVDFGIARTQDSTLTQDGALIGTPTYMSPEQFMGQKVDARSDLFSAGIILYEMLTGEKPFTGEALTTIMHHILKSSPAPPHELNYLVPESLSNVVMKALSKKPQERYTNGRAMALALRESLKDNPDMNVINETAVAIAETVVSKVPVVKQVPESVPDGTILADETVSTSIKVVKSDTPGTVAGNISADFDDYPDIPNSTTSEIMPEQSQQISSASPPSPTLVKTALQHSRLLFGSIAVLCLIAGFLIYLFTPVETLPETGEQPVIMTNESEVPSENPPVPVVKPTAPPESVSVQVYVFTTEDREIARAFDEKMRQKENIGDWLELNPGAVILTKHPGISVRASNRETQEIYDEQQLFDGITSLSVPKVATEVQYTILKKDNPKPLLSLKVSGEEATEVQNFILWHGAFQP